MAAQHGQQTESQCAHHQARPRRQVIGLSSGAAAFLVLGLGPLVAAPSANADPLTDLLDVVIEPAIAASSGISPAEFLDPSMLDAALSELATPAGWDPLGSDLSSIGTGFAGMPDTDTAAATAASATWVEQLEQQWFSSSFGQQVDSELNSLFAQLDPSSNACGLICDGANGTGGGSLSAADGQDGGVWLGDGGNGATDAAGQGGVGGNAGLVGDGGTGGNSADGLVGGNGGTGGSIAGDGGNGGTGGEGVTGVNAGTGGTGGNGGNADLSGAGGNGGTGGSAADGSAGSAGSAPNGATGGAGGAGGQVSTGGGSLTATLVNPAGNPGIAVSPVGPEAGDVYTPAPGGSQPGTVHVYDPTLNDVANNDTLAVIPVGYNPVAVAVSPVGPDAGDVYVANFDSGTVSVIDPSTNMVIHTVDVGAHPSSVAVSPTGPNAGDVYVTSDSGLMVISTDNTTVSNVVDFGRSVAVSPAGPDAGDVVVLGGASNPNDDIQFSVISPANQLIGTYDLPNSTGPYLLTDPIHGVAISPTGPDAGDIYIDAYPDYPVGTEADGTLWVVNLPANTVDTISNIAGGTMGNITDLGGIAISPITGDVFIGDPGASEIAEINNTATTISYPVNLGAVEMAFGPAGQFYASDLGLYRLQ